MKIQGKCLEVCYGLLFGHFFFLWCVLTKVVVARGLCCLKCIRALVRQYNSWTIGRNVSSDLKRFEQRTLGPNLQTFQTTRSFCFSESAVLRLDWLFCKKISGSAKAAFYLILSNRKKQKKTTYPGPSVYPQILFVCLSTGKGDSINTWHF